MRPPLVRTAMFAPWTLATPRAVASSHPSKVAARQAHPVREALRGPARPGAAEALGSARAARRTEALRVRAAPVVRPAQSRQVPAAMASAKQAPALVEPPAPRATPAWAANPASR